MKTFTKITTAMLVLAGTSFTAPLLVAGEKQNVYTDHRTPIEVRLIDARGKTYTGMAQVNVLFSHGEIEIARSPYGRLSGRFAVMPPASGKPIANPVWNWREKIKVPFLSAHTTDWPLYGLVYLSTNKKLVVRCHIGALQKLMTPHQSLFTSDNHHFEGEGLCADSKGRKLKIQIRNNAG